MADEGDAPLWSQVKTHWHRLRTPQNDLFGDQLCQRKCHPNRTLSAQEGGLLLPQDRFPARCGQGEFSTTRSTTYLAGPGQNLREETLIGTNNIRGGGDRGGIHLTEGAKSHAHGLGVGGQSHRLGPTDHPGLVQLDQVLVKGLHPTLAALDVIAQVLETILQDRLGRVHAPRGTPRRPAGTCRPASWRAAGR